MKKWSMLAAGLIVVAAASTGITFALAGDGSGGAGHDQFDMRVYFDTPVTQDDIDDAEELLGRYDEGVELLMTRCYPPMGTAVVTTKSPDSIEAELEAKSYVDHVSYRLWDESDLGEAQGPARCG